MSAARDEATRMHARFALDFALVAERLRRSTVQVRTHAHSAGAGVIWSRDGLIITNAHVVRGRHARVELTDGRAFDASITKSDRQLDIAALRIEAGNLPAATVGDANALRVGELVMAVGHPNGIAGALTVGIIHRLGQRWIEADARLGPGNSGGPLANASGRIVGINSMVAGGLALAVPSNEVEHFLSGREGRTLLGITVRPVLVPRAGKRLLGLLILEIQSRSLAEEAGLLIGDILTGAGDRRFKTPGDLVSAMSALAPGDALRLTLTRGGTEATCDVRPPREPVAAEAA